MKVGILTYHHVQNYGSLLQAYALSEAIKKQGHEAEFIDYRPYRALAYYARDLYVNRHFIAYGSKSYKMQRFFLSKLQISKKTYYLPVNTKEFHQQYGLVICGSDEIWNIESIRKFDPSYFLDFVKDKNIYTASYAASFGWTNTLGIHRKRIQELIHKFNFISVRDSNSLRLIEQECGGHAVKVLDPTFLFDYSKVMSVPKLKKYALLYVNGRLRHKEKEFLKVIAKSKELALVSVGYHHHIAQYNFLTIGPEEWLGYFSQASYVFTNCYHGTIFSILFKKPFVVFPRGNKHHKISDLMTDLGLSDRVLKRNNFDPSEANEQNLLADIEYSLVDSKLESQIFKSLDYLSKVLNDYY
jgi:hypothetical protein